MLTDTRRILENSKLCESAMLFSDMFGNQKLLFVVPDQLETHSLFNLIPQFVLSLEKPITPIFLRHRELFHLLMPPDIGHSTFHVVDNLLTAGTIIFGDDLRPEIPRPRWTLTRFRYQAEYTGELNRVRFLSHLVADKSIKSVMTEALLELMYSFLLVHGEGEIEEERIVSRFTQIANPEACEAIHQWQMLIKRSTWTTVNSGDLFNREAFWIYESLLSALFSWLDVQENENAIQRYQLRGETLVDMSKDSLGEINGVLSAHREPIHPFKLKSNQVENEYWKAVQEGVNELVKSKDVISILLHGSMARDQIFHNRSDIMDGYVILEDGCVKSRERFLTVLDSMVTSCRRMAAFGLPFHPFRFASLESFVRREQAEILMEWSSDNFSRVLIGTDVRALVGSSSAGRLYSRRMVSLIPLHGRLICCLIPALQRGAQETNRALDALGQIGKHLAKWVCLTRDIWVRGPQSIETLEKLLPGLDISVLFEINQTRGHDMSSQEICRLLTEGTLLVDQVSDAVTTWLQEPQLSELLSI